MSNMKELIKKEYKRCLIDPVYFIEKYCYIQHPMKGRMLFSLYPYQKTAIEDFENNANTIVLKARQLGFSTALANYALWLSLFHKDKNTLVIATKQETAKNLVTKTKFAFDNLPSWLKIPCIENNKLGLKFSNGSQIKAVSAASDAGRSEAVTLLVIDEGAFIENAETIWISSQATLSTGGKAVIISSPNGVGGFFHKTWEDAVNKINGFHPIKLTWHDHPERNEEWAEKERKTLGLRGFQQEHEAEFLGSGNSVIDADIIEYYKATFEREPIEKIGFDGNLWIWEQPSFTRPYIIVADVARGDGADYSAFHVIDVEKVRQVAEYKGKLDTDLFGHLLVQTGTMYNDATLVVENSNQGWAVLQTCINRSYKNIFYMSDDPRVVEETPIVMNKWGAMERRQVPGFTTSLRTRPLIINKLEEYMRSKEVIVHSSRTLNELLVFIWDKGKAQAQKGYNDDLVMSLGIGLWVRDTSLHIFQNAREVQEKAIQGITSTTSPVMKHNPLAYNPYIFPVKLGGNIYAESIDEDFSWMLK